MSFAVAVGAIWRYSTAGPAYCRCMTTRSIVLAHNHHGYCAAKFQKQCIPETKRNMRPAPSPSCCGHTTHSTKHSHFDSLTPATDMRRTRHIQMQDKCLLKVRQNLFSGPKFGLCRRHSRHEQGRLTACPPNFTSKQLNFKHQEASGASELCAKR